MANEPSAWDRFFVRHHKRIVLSWKCLFIAAAFSGFAATLPTILSWRAPSWYRPLFAILTYVWMGALGLGMLAAWAWSLTGRTRRG